MLELSVREVFEIMLGCRLDPPDAEQTLKTECTAMVGLAGQLCGVVTLRCSADAASLMTSRMLGVDPKDTTTEMWDAIGEIANMIAGNFKNKLTGLADGCLLSVPTVIIGEDYCMHSLADGGSIELTLKFEGTPICAALEIHS
jgi:chemotaxis protein CheX